MRIVVIGTSAGGADALQRLFKRLPADFPAAVLVVMHIGSHYSILPKILERHSRMPVRHAVDGEPVRPGVVLVAPPDHHLLLEDGMTRLSKGAKENFSRPAVDPLFRSTALYYQQNAIGVVLTGLLDDGTIGLQAIKTYGGLALVQDPEDADEPSMPRSALQHVDIDACLPLEALADRLCALVAASPPEQTMPSPFSKAVETQARFDLRQKTDIAELEKIAVPSGFSCPECQGSLWEIKDTHPVHYRCHTGHSYTTQGLLNMQGVTIEEAVWTAIRALHEKQMLLRRLARNANRAAPKSAAEEHMATAAMLERHSETLRRMIAKRDGES
jgi:two-component system chemotaxis response regulator CheB